MGSFPSNYVEKVAEEDEEKYPAAPTPAPAATRQTPPLVKASSAPGPASQKTFDFTPATADGPAPATAPSTAKQNLSTMSPLVSPSGKKATVIQLLALEGETREALCSYCHHCLS